MLGTLEKAQFNPKYSLKAKTTSFSLMNICFLSSYQLFLFDLDGVLVDTEFVHYQAYKQVCLEYGVHLNWSQKKYCLIAHYGKAPFQKALFQDYPLLKGKLDDWNCFYQKKLVLLPTLFRQHPPPLMPGAQKIVHLLQESEINHCVVTNSSKYLASLFCEQHSILKKIPHWFTREQYSQPKPNPECYRKAIQMLSSPGDSIIGFEDSPRGLTALKKALPLKRGRAVFITSLPYPTMPELMEGKVEHTPSLLEWLKKQAANSKIQCCV